MWTPSCFTKCYLYCLDSITNVEAMELMILMFFLWAFIYVCIQRKFQTQSAEWVSRVLAMCHSIVITKLAELTFIFGDWPLDNFGETNTKWYTFLVSCSAGYFLFETLWCLYMNSEGIMMLLHHFLSLSALFSSLYFNVSGAEAIYGLLVTEATNPFLQVRWFLRDAGLHKTVFAAVNECVFAALFGYFRFVLATILVGKMLITPKCGLTFKIGGVGLYIISILWMVFIVKMVQKKVNLLRKGKVTHEDDLSRLK